MKKFVSALLLIFPLFGGAQPTKKLERKQRFYSEEYHVLKSDRSVWHGKYERHIRDNNRFVVGYYKNNKRDSIWTYYDFDREITYKYDYTHNKLLFLKRNDVAARKPELIRDGQREFEGVIDTPPLHLDGSPDRILLSQIRYPGKAREGSIVGRVEIAFTVHSDGTTSNYHVKQSVHESLDKEAMRVIKLLDGRWYPAVYQGRPVEVEFVVPVIFTLE